MSRIGSPFFSRLQYGSLLSNLPSVNLWTPINHLYVRLWHLHLIINPPHNGGNGKPIKSPQERWKVLWGIPPVPFPLPHRRWEKSSSTPRYYNNEEPDLRWRKKEVNLKKLAIVKMDFTRIKEQSARSRYGPPHQSSTLGEVNEFFKVCLGWDIFAWFPWQPNV